MDNQAAKMSHWTRNTPGVTGPRPSKRDSTISLEDPYLVALEHHRLSSQNHDDPQTFPSQQHGKPALGLLIPQEIYHCDPSPLPSPDADCPPLPSDSDSTIMVPGRLSPLEAYLKDHDNGERRRIGLPSQHCFDELPVPAQEINPSSCFTSSSTVDSSWDVVESPNALINDPTNDAESLHVVQGSEKTSSWDILESSSPLEPASQGAKSPGPVTSCQPFRTAEIASPTSSYASQGALFAIPGYIEANPIGESASDPPVTREQAYLRMGHSQGRSRSNSISPAEDSKIRSLKKHRVRVRRFKNNDAETTK